MRERMPAGDEVHVAVAITGASGAMYARRLLEILSKSNARTHLIISAAGEKILKLELGAEPESLISDRVTRHHYKNFAARIASGSFPLSAMVIVPCSMGTLGAIAQGISMNLIHRCADVCIKEGRTLIMVPRETPLNSIHLENMLRLSRSGVTILPAMPGFYGKPQSISDLVDFVVARILDQLGISQGLMEPWKGMPDTE